MTTAIEPPGGGNGGTFDAPNQQVVRPDGSAPWDEGTGGATAAPKEPAKPTRRWASKEPTTTTEPASEPATDTASE